VGADGLPVELPSGRIGIRKSPQVIRGGVLFEPPALLE